MARGADTKNIPSDIVGKRIAGVLLLESADGLSQPSNQLVLCFEDGTSYELWGGPDGIRTAGGFDRESLESLLVKVPPNIVIRQVLPEGAGGHEP